jgi:hypothetical protein
MVVFRMMCGVLVPVTETKPRPTELVRAAPLAALDMDMAEEIRPIIADRWVRGSGQQATQEASAGGVARTAK